MTPFSSVRTPKVAELVSAQIRRRIISGELEEGATLPPERELTEQLGVSRPTLKEAFRILESEGLLTLRRGARGAVVTHPSIRSASTGIHALFRLGRAELADIFEVSAAVEVPAARRFAERCTDESIGRLVDAFARQEAAMSNMEDLVAANLAFHAVLLEECENPAMRISGLVMHELIKQHGAVEFGEIATQSQASLIVDTLNEHRDFIDLLESKDPDRAEDYWRKHLASTVAMVRGVTHVERPALEL
jgi:DNA-binding FadR family transcriptional regulator